MKQWQDLTLTHDNFFDLPVDRVPRRWRRFGSTSSYQTIHLRKSTDWAQQTAFAH
jgi:hypothetical protein